MVLILRNRHLFYCKGKGYVILYLQVIIMQYIFTKITSFILSLLTLLGVVNTSPYNKPIDNYNGGDPCIVEDETGTYYTFTTGGGVDIRKIKSFNFNKIWNKGQI